MVYQVEDSSATSNILSINWSYTSTTNFTGNTFYTVDSNNSETYYTASTQPSNFEIADNTKKIVFNNILINSFESFPTNIILNDATGLLYNYVGSGLTLKNVDISDATVLGVMTSKQNDNIGSVDLSNWKTNNLTAFTSNYQCPLSDFADGLTSLNLSGWDVSNVTNSNGVFKGLYSMTELNITGWDLSNSTYSTGMFSPFYNCASLNKIILGETTQAMYDWLYAALTVSNTNVNMDNLTIEYTIV